MATMESPDRHILLIDAYDSFTHNLAALLREVTGALIYVVRMDNLIFKSHHQTLFNAFDAVVIGPGPGSPNNPEDMGFIHYLWELSDYELLPVFGVCLGFQSMCRAFGATIERLRVPKHGIISRVVHSGSWVFSEVGDVDATRYHSLHANIHHDVQTPKGYEESLKNTDILWNPSHTAPELEPLAWALDKSYESDNSDNGPVLMAAKHLWKPFWGVQYHPESICTSQSHIKVLQKWWAAAQHWNDSEGRYTKVTDASLKQCLSRLVFPLCFPEVTVNQMSVRNSEFEETYRRLVSCGLGRIGEVPARVGNNPNFNPIALCDMLANAKREFVLLESAGSRSQQSELSRYTIIGFIIPHAEDGTRKWGTETLQYSNGCMVSKITGPDGVERVARYCTKEENCTPWSFLRHYMTLVRFSEGIEWSPFWGGVIGHIAYEEGLRNLEIIPNQQGVHEKDMSWTFIERSMVYDHLTGNFCIQSLRAGDEDWIDYMHEMASSNSMHFVPSEEFQLVDLILDDTLRHSFIEGPEELEYKSKVRDCKEEISAGNSYELCLTGQTAVYLPKAIPADNSWQLYKRLRTLNPAPFAAYMKIQDVTMVSSSPERFMQWGHDNGRLQMRPIKGTVKKNPGMTLERATEHLSSDKERAENLMIVDLIRHDLHGICGPCNVTVPKLMVVEEYETVYQLVSVIEADINKKYPSLANPPPFAEAFTVDDSSDGLSPRDAGFENIDVLEATFPPGSMTGAPKLRSCQILNRIEEYARRGVYSGVQGYISVSGSADLSVVIRSAVRCDGDTIEHGGDKWECWKIGAGGAVTALSTPEGEWEEMLLKLSSTLRAFMPAEQQVQPRPYGMGHVRTESESTIRYYESNTGVASALENLHVADDHSVVDDSSDAGSNWTGYSSSSPDRLPEEALPSEPEGDLSLD